MRIFMEGAFDLTHYGHANAFRHGKNLFPNTYLIVGVNSSESIAEAKGSLPVMTDEERCACIRGSRFVDEVIEKTPYVMTDEYLGWVMQEYGIQFVVHGDDPCLVNGQDVYGRVKELGMFRSIPRTVGVSTTHVLGELLQRAGYCQGTSVVSPVEACPLPTTSETLARRTDISSLMSSFSDYMRRDCLVPGPHAPVAYVVGTWDLFQPWHALQLARIRARWPEHKVVVGVLDDIPESESHSILTLNERALMVMACRSVDDVLLQAPREMDEEFIASMGIQVVLHETDFTMSDSCEPSSPGLPPTSPVNIDDDDDCFAVPKRMGIYEALDDTTKLGLDELGTRVQGEAYLRKFQAKQKVEEGYYEEHMLKMKETKQKRIRSLSEGIVMTTTTIAQS